MLQTNTQDYEVICSLTSWKGRLNSEIVQLVLYSLLKQNTTYRYKVVLVLSEEEFPRKNAEVPKNIISLAERVPHFEILWTYRNTKALKKLTAPMATYPNLPIITTDDDIIVKPEFIQRFMDCHRSNPQDAIYAYLWDFPGNTEIKISGMARLFPPNTLYPLDEKWFYTIFKSAEDDLWNAIRLWLAHTNVRSLDSWPFVCEATIGNTAFRDVYRNIDSVTCYKQLMTALKRTRC